VTSLALIHGAGDVVRRGGGARCMLGPHADA
jgi:hypothetical protein